MPRPSLSAADLTRLRDILAAIETVQRYCVRVSEARFMTDIVLQDAVVRRVMIVGEAASKLAAEAKFLLPQVQWSSIISMRHILVHDYSDMNAEILWRTVRHDLPELKKTLLQAIDFSRGIVKSML
jgi:uncharacterized protein with HEPN domain